MNKTQGGQLKILESSEPSHENSKERDQQSSEVNIETLVSLPGEKI